MGDYKGRLVGAGGIEPPNGGIKIRCLTAWLRPNLLISQDFLCDVPSFCQQAGHNNACYREAQMILCAFFPNKQA